MSLPTSATSQSHRAGNAASTMLTRSDVAWLKTAAQYDVLALMKMLHPHVLRVTVKVPACQWACTVCGCSSSCCNTFSKQCWCVSASSKQPEESHSSYSKQRFHPLLLIAVHVESAFLSDGVAKFKGILDVYYLLFDMRSVVWPFPRCFTGCLLVWWQKSHKMQGSLASYSIGKKVRLAPNHPLSHNCP